MFTVRMRVHNIHEATPNTLTVRLSAPAISRFNPSRARDIIQSGWKSTYNLQANTTIYLNPALSWYDVSIFVGVNFVLRTLASRRKLLRVGCFIWENCWLCTSSDRLQRWRPRLGAEMNGWCCCEHTKFVRILSAAFCACECCSVLFVPLISVHIRFDCNRRYAQGDWEREAATTCGQCYPHLRDLLKPAHIWYNFVFVWHRGDTAHDAISQ